MPTFIRLTEYRDSDSKEAGFFDPNNRHTANQNDFIKIPGSPIIYWFSNKIIDLFTGNLFETVPIYTGMATSDNGKFLRFWHEAEQSNINYNATSIDDTKNSSMKWFPYNKGGGSKKWYGNFDYVVNFANDGEEIKNEVNKKYPYLKGNTGFYIRYQEHYFKEGLTWSAVSSGKITVRKHSKNSIFSNAGFVAIPNENLNYYIALLNSNIASFIVDGLASTININASDVAKLPIIFPNSSELKFQIDALAYQCIEISRQEWDSRETSWDFHCNELIRHKTNDGKIQSTFTAYCDYWHLKFHQLHTNEEELNRIFIEIYGLEEELTPDVELEDITILKSESKIVDDEFVFNADEIARQFISYAVGCMFGRYSLDHEGLVIANMGQAIPTDTLFEIDDDNIIPVLEEEVFSDDIAARFERFVAAAFGEEFVGENLRWIEQSVGMDIRKYFVAEFYKDHVRRYKKRPIYWMVQSPKKGFSALIYMHRYQSDTMARVQTMYLREYLTKIDSLIEHTRSVSNNPDSSAKDAKEAGKTLSKLEAKQRDALDFDRGDMSRAAALQIAIDLDDGVKVNYQKFKGVLPDIGLSKGED